MTRDLTQFVMQIKTLADLTAFPYLKPWFRSKVLRTNLSYGGLIGVEDLSQDELLQWLSVKDIIVYDPAYEIILFDIGVAHQMSLSLFEDPPVCNPQGL